MHLEYRKNENIKSKTHTYTVFIGPGFIGPIKYFRVTMPTRYIMPRTPKALKEES